jgi:micrococcal nuclease
MSLTPPVAKKLGIGGIILLLLAFYSQIHRDIVAVETVADKMHEATSSLHTSSVYYKVVKVVDGDTVTLEMQGVNEKVRLLGINTPETVDPRRPVQCFGKEASARAKELMSGKIVRLEYDDSQGTRDAYNRILAYVYLEDGVMVNRQLIAEGYAYEYTYMTPYAYQKEFRELQNLARTSKRGLWAPETCSGSKNFSQ